MYAPGLEVSCNEHLNYMPKLEHTAQQANALTHSSRPTRATRVLQGKKVLVMEDTACKAGDRTIVQNFWYEFAPGERIGIVGPNGAGKSLLDMITGDRQLQAGHREVGETTALGYFRQHVPDVKPTLKIIDYIR